jgi:hypothetical protein
MSESSDFTGYFQGGPGASYQEAYYRARR